MADQKREKASRISRISQNFTDLTVAICDTKKLNLCPSLNNRKSCTAIGTHETIPIIGYRQWQAPRTPCPNTVHASLHTPILCRSGCPDAGWTYLDIVIVLFCNDSQNMSTAGCRLEYIRPVLCDCWEISCQQKQSKSRKCRFKCFANPHGKNKLCKGLRESNFLLARTNGKANWPLYWCTMLYSNFKHTLWISFGHTSGQLLKIHSHIEATVSIFVCTVVRLHST